MKMDLTPAAEKFIRRMVRCASNSKTGFRLKVRNGGCSGLAVEFDLADEPGEDEIVWKYSDIHFFLDSVSCLLLDGSVVDFIDNRSLTGFTVTTPGKRARICVPISTLVPVNALIRR